MNFRIVDDSGAALAEGRNFEQIVQKLTGRGDELPAMDAGPWSQDGVVSWRFPPLPEYVELEYGGIPIRRYPTLIDRGDGVALRLLESKSQAERQLRRGLRRLFAIAEERELRTQVAWLPRLNEVDCSQPACPAEA